jgi:predicted RNA-binding protein with PIN domain
MPSEEDSDAEIEHRWLRSALEFAVDMAAETAKRKPPMDSPKELKAYFNVERLPTRALGRVRRAVDADDVFRTRIAHGAIPELVDPIGRLWLRRPDGWRDDIARAAAELERGRESGDAGRALKKSEKRRKAAEHAARRAVADIIGVQATAGQARDEADDLRVRLGVAEEAADGLRHDLIDARTEARHARDREGAAIEKLAVLEVRLDAAPVAADPPEADPTGENSSGGHPGGVDPVGASDEPTDGDRAELEELRRDVALAASEASRLAEMLRRAAADALDTGIGSGDGAFDASLRPSADSSAEPVSRPRDGAARDVAPRDARRRSALRLPGGVSAASEEAANFLLKSGATVLVDGYNVAMLAWPARDLCDQRASLIDAIENVARRFGTSVTIVFDGSTVVGGFAARRRLVRVTYSPEGITADDVIRDEVARGDPSAPVVVVTNDAEIVRDVKAVGANVISSTTFIGLL